MDNVQLAAYCIAMLAEYVQEPWLAELRDIYAVPTSGMILFSNTGLDPYRQAFCFAGGVEMPIK